MQSLEARIATLNAGMDDGRFVLAPAGYLLWSRKRFVKCIINWSEELSCG
jgi:hypothetical protein